MKKATKFTIYLGLYIVALFSIGICFTFINDALQASGFFGDTLFKPYTGNYGQFIKYHGIIDQKYEWGPRHYWYFWMCILLFILSALRIVIWCVWYWDKKVIDKLVK